MQLSIKTFKQQHLYTKIKATGPIGLKFHLSHSWSGKLTVYGSYENTYA